MSILGFCLTTRTDEPVDANRYCLPHQALTIPPTRAAGGDRWQTWRDGAWWKPEKPKAHATRFQLTDRFANEAERVQADRARVEARAERQRAERREKAS